MIYVVTGPQGSGKTGVARALLRGLARTGVVMTTHAGIVQSPLGLESALRDTRALLLEGDDAIPDVRTLEDLVRPFLTDGAPAVAITLIEVIGSLEGHPYLKEIRIGA